MKKINIKKNTWMTIEDLVNDEKATIGPLREIYENQKEDCTINPEARKILELEDGENIIYEHAGKKYALVLTDQTINEGSGYGLTYKRGVYIVDIENKNRIGGFYPQTYRAGMTLPKIMINIIDKDRYWIYPEQDNFGIQYMSGKIIRENEDGVVVGLQTRDVLKIVEYKKNTAPVGLEFYDLRPEQGFRKRKETAKNAIADFDLEKLEDLITGIEQEEILTVDAKYITPEQDLALILGQKFDRKYDAKVDRVNLYLAAKNKGVILLGTINPKTKHHWGEKFYKIKGTVKDLKIEKDESMINISAAIEAWYLPCNAPGCGGIGKNQLQDRQVFRYTVDF